MCVCGVSSIFRQAQVVVAWARFLFQWLPYMTIIIQNFTEIDSVHIIEHGDGIADFTNTTLNVFNWAAREKLAKVADIRYGQA